jgi:hypothetical protein
MAKTKDGFDVNYSGGVVKVSKSGVPQDKFDDELSRAEEILSNFKMTKPGSTWGSDGIGYMVQKKAGHVIVNKSGVIPKWAKIGMEKINESVNEGALNEDAHDQMVAAKLLTNMAVKYADRAKARFAKDKDKEQYKFEMNDVKTWLKIAQMIKAGNWAQAADTAFDMDTAAREYIPDITWKLMRKYTEEDYNESIKARIKNVIREELLSEIGNESFGMNITILGKGNDVRNMIMKTLSKWEELPGVTEIRSSRIVGGGNRDHSINTKK